MCQSRTESPQAITLLSYGPVQPEQTRGQRRHLLYQTLNPVCLEAPPPPRPYTLNPACLQEVELLPGEVAVGRGDVPEALWGEGNRPLSIRDMAGSHTGAVASGHIGPAATLAQEEQPQSPGQARPSSVVASHPCRSAGLPQTSLLQASIPPPSKRPPLPNPSHPQASTTPLPNPSHPQASTLLCLT